jgi:hypothetical protein
MFGMDLLLVSGRRGAVRSVASTRSGEWRALVHFMSEKRCRTSEGAARDRTGNSLGRPLRRSGLPRMHRGALDGALTLVYMLRRLMDPPEPGYGCWRGWDTRRLAER